MELTYLAKAVINERSHTYVSLNNVQPFHYFIINNFPYVASASITLTECVRRLNKLLERKNLSPIQYAAINAGLKETNVYYKMIGETDVKIVRTTIDLTDLLNLSQDEK